LNCAGPWVTDYPVFVETMVNITMRGTSIKKTARRRLLFSKAEPMKCVSLWVVGRFTEFEMSIKILPREDCVEALPSLDVRHTQDLIKVMFSEDSCISASGFKTSLLCPLSKSRMQWPCKSLKCKHIQPFDGKVFLQLNKDRKEWACPVCNVKITYHDLRVDSYFKNILLYNPGLNEVALNADGGWSFVLYQPVEAIDLLETADGDEFDEVSSDEDYLDEEASNGDDLDKEASDKVDLVKDSSYRDVKDEVVILDDNYKKTSESEKATESLPQKSCPSQNITKAFKLYNRLKTVKKMIVTTGIADFIQKGKQKFGYPASQDVKVLMEEDGTEIDDDESLLFLDSYTLLVLAYAEDNYTP